MSKELKKKEEELQETFSRQLELVKAESEDWIKIGGLALAGGLIAFAFIRSRKKRKNRDTEKAMEVLAREGLLSKEIEKKLTQESKSSFWPSMSQRLLILGMAYAKEKFLPNLFNPENEDVEVEKRSK